MKNFRRVKKILAFAGAALLLSLLTFESAAQCGGTYFKRSSTTLVQQPGNFYEAIDMTGDGNKDLLGNYGTKFYILPANGTGGFGTPIVLTFTQNLSNYIVGDFDNDNLKDIFFNFSNFSQAPFYRIYKNNGNGTFTPQTQGSLTGIIQNFVHLIDINNDGIGDLITTTTSPSINAGYRLGNADGTFQSYVQIATTNNIRAGDFNTDGKIDFIARNTLLLNQGGGVFAPVPNTLNLESSELIRDVRDYTGDGKPDIITDTQFIYTKVSLLKNMGDNTFQRTDYLLASENQSARWEGRLITGNFSGDASPEFIYRLFYQSRTVVFTNDGAGNLTPQIYDYKFRTYVAGDFNGDGKDDAAVISDSYPASTTPKKLYNSEITVTVEKNVCNRAGQTRLVDFDRSGSTDYSYWTPSDGKWAYLATEYQPAPRTASINWGSSSFGDIPTPGDFDGDAMTDFAVYRNSTGVWWIVRSSDWNSAAVQFGLPGDKPVVGDYDGDSISDVAVWRPSDGNWYIYFMGTQSYTIVHWGQNGDKPVPEDYDGDGKTDLAVFRPSTGIWYYLKSSDLNFVALQFGLATDRPVPADYDGDGKADIAVYREDDTVFHVLRSFNLTNTAFQLGNWGDIQQPGDYDGDYVSDFGQYRPSTQRWFVTGNAQSNVNFGASGVVPTSSMLKIE